MTQKSLEFLKIRQQLNCSLLHLDTNAVDWPTVITRAVRYATPRFQMLETLKKEFSSISLIEHQTFLSVGPQTHRKQDARSLKKTVGSSVTSDKRLAES